MVQAGKIRKSRSKFLVANRNLIMDNEMKVLLSIFCFWSSKNEKVVIFDGSL